MQSSSFENDPKRAAFSDHTFLSRVTLTRFLAKSSDLNDVRQQRTKYSRHPDVSRRNPGHLHQVHIVLAFTFDEQIGDKRGAILAKKKILMGQFACSDVE